MNWFLFAFVAPVLWSLVNISDQYLVTKYGKSQKGPGALVLFSSLVGVFVAIFIYLFTEHVFDISFSDKVLMMTSGIFTILWVILYLHALEFEDVSGVVPWFVTVPVFGYILGYLFLGEDLNAMQKIGSLIVIIGTLVLSLDFSKTGKYKFKGRVMLYMLPSCVLLAVIGVMFKYVTHSGSFWVSNFWINVGLGISGIFIYIFFSNYRTSFWQMLKVGGSKIFALNAVSEIITVLGNLASSYATLLAPVVLVLMIANFQPGILLILTLIGSKFYPSVVKENLDTNVLYPKILAVSIIIIGSVFLFQ